MHFEFIMEGFLNPTEVLKQLKLTKDMVAADFGCGSGGWTIPLAKILNDGIVYAIDILEKPLAFLKSKMNLEKIKNIRLIKSDIENKKGSTLPDNSVDIVLITNLLFQIEKKDEVLKEAKRILKDNGQLLIIDWKKESSLGPLTGRISLDEAKELALANGFQVEEEINVGPYHWALLLVK